MSPITLILFASTLIFGLIAILFSARQEAIMQEKDKMAEMMKALTDGLILLGAHNEVVAMNDEARGLLHIHTDHPVLNDITNSFGNAYDIAGKIDQAIKQNLRVDDKEVKMGDHVINISITPLYGMRNFDGGKKVTIKGASIVIQDRTVEKNEEKNREDTTNMMVHELRAPLTAIKDASALMLESDSLEKEERGKLLSIIREQAMVLLDTVTTILDSAKLRDGKFTIHKFPTDVRKMVRDQMSLFAQQAKNKNITFIQDVASDIPLLSMDSMRMAQVLNNLLSNSLKFTPEGGMIIVRSFIKNGSMGESLMQTPWLVLEVRDTGMGIAPEQQQNLFTKFFQAASVDTARKNPGSGLGLYVVKGIIEAHGGAINVHSEQNKGTTMSATIPAIMETASINNNLHQKISEVKPLEHSTAPYHGTTSHEGIANQSVLNEEAPYDKHLN